MINLKFNNKVSNSIFSFIPALLIIFSLILMWEFCVYIFDIEKWLLPSPSAIFQDFIKNSYDQLSNSNKNAFSKLLDQQDLDILNWIIGKDNPRDSELVEIISIIKSSRKNIKA